MLHRWHGIGPMGGTDLDAILRNLGVTTIVAVGVSLNVAIPNLVMDAVNAGYRVVLPRDAVAGIPADYGTAIIDNTLSLLATVTTTDDLIEVWRQHRNSAVENLVSDGSTWGLCSQPNSRRTESASAAPEPARCSSQRRSAC